MKRKHKCKLQQWYDDHWKSIELSGDGESKLAVFRINGKYIHYEIPMALWIAAMNDHPAKCKLRQKMMAVVLAEYDRKRHEATTL
jgi:hypothetical protein